ncbi:hypothetical protein [Asticcacaulis endophyticus]|uniref:Uncharacterized protein n=1 Tax=Asticcacaulis endophyticus TaxID=1395890 RepID=A0A918Q6I4_9CAUL|nr:hypothetical protein [Asticcacaulis endophyticus]GGZ35575.1 hypothetical protein GCM10011273_22610 [Asticcacaulis endophyticus]
MKHYIDKAETLVTKHRCEMDQASVDKRIADLHDANAVNISASELRKAIDQYGRFVGKMDEFCSFFTPENIAVIDRWGRDLDQFSRFTIGHSATGAKRSIAIKAVNETTRLEANAQMWMYSKSLLT